MKLVIGDPLVTVRNKFELVLSFTFGDMDDTDKETILTDDSDALVAFFEFLNSKPDAAAIINMKEDALWGDGKVELMENWAFDINSGMPYDLDWWSIHYYDKDGVKRMVEVID